MYKIPKNRTPERHYDRRPKAQFIIKCINDGLTNDQIVEKLKTEFDMPDRTKSLATIYRIKTELKKSIVTCSSTIENYKFIRAYNLNELQS